MRGQLSAEMLIILAVLIAVVVIVASQLMKTADRASGKVDTASEAVFNKTDAAIGAGTKKITGETCISDDECRSGSCDIISSRCT